MCNNYMGWLDNGMPFRYPDWRLVLRTVLFVEHWRKCHECAAGVPVPVPAFEDQRMRPMADMLLDMCMDHIALSGEVTVIAQRLRSGMTGAGDVGKAAELAARLGRIRRCSCLKPMYAECVYLCDAS